MLKKRYSSQAGFLLILLATLMVGCASPEKAITTLTPQPATYTAIHKPKIGDLPSASATPAPTNTILPSHSTTSTATTFSQLCSPLEEIKLERLPELISNPYAPPAPGSDMPHQGVDFSLVDPVAGYALDGHPVQAALAGEVAAVVHDRVPYGYAVLVETRYQGAPTTIRSVLVLPTPLPFLLIPGNLTCPQSGTNNLVHSSTGQDPYKADEVNERSFYIMYAHLQGPLEIQTGDRIACGQRLGLVGASGNALYPHLHIEIRVGPSGMRFESMAHYDNSATQAEMASYCNWRVSGMFQLIDPMDLLSLVP